LSADKYSGDDARFGGLILGVLAGRLVKIRLGSKSLLGPASLVTFLGSNPLPSRPSKRSGHLGVGPSEDQFFIS